MKKTDLIKVYDKIDEHGEKLAAIEQQLKNLNGSTSRAFDELKEAKAFINDDCNKMKAEINWNRTILLLGIGGFSALSIIATLISIASALKII